MTDIERARRAATELRILVGETIEALEFFDSDDGHAALIVKGIVAESRRIEDEFEDVLFDAAGRARVACAAPGAAGSPCASRRGSAATAVH